MKLKAPVENQHHAFCTPGCYDLFHSSYRMARAKGDRLHIIRRRLSGLGPELPILTAVPSCGIAVEWEAAERDR